MNSDKQLILSTQSYTAWAARFHTLTDMELGEIQRKDFPDGEHYQRIVTPVDGRKVLLISGTINDRETLELFDLANAIVDGGASRLRVVLPYFGYSTMERAVRQGEAVKAKYRARLLSNGLPRAPLGNRFYMLDLHSEGIPQYFENGAQTTHIYAKSIVMKVARRLSTEFGPLALGARQLEVTTELPSGSFVLASTDAGRMKWVESLARDMGVSPAFAYKERIDGATTVSLGISGPVKDKFVVIYDDMIRTGSSLMNAARAYLEAGASGVAAMATHALFPGESLARIKASGLFHQLVVTDSHPRSRELESEFLRVESCSDLFVPHLSADTTDSIIIKELKHAVQ